MKDYFSKQAVDYSKFRPTYPAEMIASIVSFCESKTSALDVATGNGQVAVMLADHFETVHAIDISEKQLQNATARNNIIYKKETAETTSFNDHTFDLVIVAQAIHWFDFDRFYAEVRRILKPNGIIAVIGYGLFTTNPETDAILMDLYENIVGPYWKPERQFLDENYTTIPFPFAEIATPKFENNLEWSFEQLTGYLETWSATQNYKDKNNKNPIDIIRDELKQSWESGDKKVTFPLLLRIGKNKPSSHSAAL